MISRIRPIAIDVTVNEESLNVVLKDGGELRFPLRRLSKLWVATPEQRAEFRVSAFGKRLLWDQLDEYISVNELMRAAERLHLEQRLTSCVPSDFPWDTTPASLSGTQPKLSGRWIDGRFIVGLTAEERFIRWDMCEHLALQLVPKALKDAAKFPTHSHGATLMRIRRAIEGKAWTERVETDWLTERIRVLLGW